MQNESEIRRAVRKEIKTVLKEDNIVVRVLTKILDNLHGKAQKRAIRRFMSTPEVIKLIKSDKPKSAKFEKSLEKTLKRYM